jgi:DMSO/TMAO reductase YedYZ heme-binding membrane subunit
MDTPTAPLPLKVEEALPQPKPKTDWRFQFEQYGSAVLVAVPIFIAFSVYLYYRRGYYDLYIVNKILAGEATVLLGFVLLIGPLSRYFTVFDKYVQYRKELGIVAMWLAVAHSLSSLFFLPGHFSLERFFTTGLLTTVFGLAAGVILIGLFMISREKIKHALGVKRWWHMQFWGVRTAFLLIALHVGFLKMSSWISWYQKGGGAELAHPEWPGAGLLVGWFIAFVIVVRLAELGGKKFGTMMWYLCLAALSVVYVGTFWWGQQFVR